jgi:hypothetical protein
MAAANAVLNHSASTMPTDAIRRVASAEPLWNEKATATTSSGAVNDDRNPSARFNSGTFLTGIMRGRDPTTRVAPDPAVT